MSNFAVAIKDEIRRLAKREIKFATGSTKQAVAQYRRDIAKLKRLLQAQQKEIAFLKTQERKRLGQPQAAGETLESVRFSARSVRAERTRLGLSLQGYARLLGVSPLTIYNWEHGKARPGESNLAALVALRRVGKREAVKRLEMLKAERALPAENRGSRPPRQPRRSVALQTLSAEPVIRIRGAEVLVGKGVVELQVEVVEFLDRLRRAAGRAGPIVGLVAHRKLRLLVDIDLRQVEAEIAAGHGIHHLDQRAAAAVQLRAGEVFHFALAVLDVSWPMSIRRRTRFTSPISVIG